MQSKTLLPIVKRFFKKVSPYVITSLWILMLWLVITDVLEMVTTEWNEWQHFLPKEWKTLMLVICLICITIVFTFWQKTHKKFSLLAFIVSGVLFCASLFGHQRYISYHQWLQKLPRLETISTKETIQADRVTITGKNFGPPDKAGSVKVGEVEFIVVTWDDEEVVVEQPVPNRYFVDDMVLTNNYGNQLIIENFSIKDPLEVWQ